MKILLVTHMLFPEHVGGKEKYIVQLAKQFNQGHSVGIVCYTRKGKWFREIQMQGVTIYGVRWLPKPSPISQIALILTTVIITSLHRFEIAYINSSTAPELAGLFSKIFTRTPYVMAVHNPSELLSIYLPKLSSWIKKLTLRKASEVIAISKEIADILVQKRFVDRSRINVIPPGVESELFELARSNRRTTEITTNSQIVLTARRLVKEKNIDVLLRAIKILIDGGLSVNCVIVGQGPELKSLVRLSIEFGIEKNVHFSGFIPEDQLRKLIQSANCFVIPSSREGTPVALLESMALGKPVVATSVGGIPDVLPTKELLVRPGDPYALATKIKMVLKSDRFANEVGTKNRQVAEQYSWKRIAARLLDVFHRASLQERNVGVKHACKSKLRT